MHSIAAKFGALALAPFLMFGGSYNAHVGTEAHASSTPTTTASCTTTISDNLYFGLSDSGTSGQVTALQSFLEAKGYLKSAPTGFFGYATFAAVRSYQGDKGIEATGYVGAQTRDAITADCGTTTPPTNGDLSITGIDAPTTLVKGVQGTWTVHATADASTTLRYSVTWGDENMIARGLAAAMTVNTSSTFTHTYDKKGTYTPTFTVTDSNGKTVTQAAASVVVSDVDHPAKPHITAIDHASGIVGATVTLTGTDFATSSAVTVGGVAATSTINSSTSITFTVPNLKADTYNVVVKDDAGKSNTVKFTVLKAAAVTRISINGLDAPTTLAVDADGTWTVHASSNVSSNLHYSVKWGDENTMLRMLAAIAPTQSSATFTHAYGTAGTYNPVFTVSDDNGHSETASASVMVTE